MAKVDVFAANDRVIHSVHGLGTIVTADVHYTTIAFDTDGSRKFLTAMVQLARTEVPPPPAPKRAQKPTRPPSKRK